MPIASPADIADLEEWKSAKDTATISVDGSGTITAVADKANATHDLSGITGAPKSGTRTHNGHNVIDLDGASAIDGALAQRSAPHTIAWCGIVDSLAAGVEQNFWGGRRTFRSGVTVADGKWACQNEAASARAAATIGFHTFVMVVAVADVRQYIDGADVTPAGATATAGSTTGVIGGEGSLSSGGPVTNFADGAFAEGVRYNRALTPEEAADLHAYMMANWAATETGDGSATGALATATTQALAGAAVGGAAISAAFAPGAASPVQGAAVGGAVAPGALAAATASEILGAAIGAAVVSASFASTTAQPLDGTAAGDAIAHGALNTATSTPVQAAPSVPSGDALASGAFATVNAQALAGAAAGGALAAGALPVVAASAIAGSAAGSAVASGAFATATSAPVQATLSVLPPVSISERYTVHAEARNYEVFAVARRYEVAANARSYEVAA